MIPCAVWLELSFAPSQWGIASSHRLPTSMGILHVQQDYFLMKIIVPKSFCLSFAIWWADQLSAGFE